MNKDTLLNDLFYSLDSSVSYGSPNSLFKVAKERDPSISLKEVKEWLSSQLTYTLHKPVRKTFPTRPVVVHGIDELWQMDLVDLSKLSRFNKNYKYLLTAIDVFSKFAWVLPLKTKSASDMKRVFEDLFTRTRRRPKFIQTDAGTEFLNSAVQTILKQSNIKFYTTHSERKASVVERFNRTFKSLMFKYFTKQNGRNYIDILPELVNKYNNTYHRSIKMEPIEVSKENEPLVWINLYENRLKNKNKTKISIGDHVRISVERGPFKKSYLQGWSEEIFIVKNVIKSIPFVYKITDQAGEDIKGTFYQEELQKVTEPRTYRIEKVIRKKRNKDGNLLLLVKWSGYPEKFNSWITEADLS